MNRNTREMTRVLPRELLMNILSRLPVKTLCKFRCVSREWRNLISDRHFINLHSDRSKRKPKLVFKRFKLNYDSRRNSYQVAIQLSTVDAKEGNLSNKFTKVVDERYINSWVPGSNLLMCVVCFKSVYVCNPSTEEVVKLPDPCHLFIYQSFGFGFLPMRNEYKLVHLWTQYDGRLACEIFTLEDGRESNSGSWRLTGFCPSFIWEGHSPVSVDGVVYWLGWDQDEPEDNKHLVSLDLYTEEFRIVPYPSHFSSVTFIDVDLDFMSLVELRGCLCLVDNVSMNAVMNVWMLKDRENLIWEKLYSINFNGLDGDDDCLFCSPMDDRDGEVLVESNDGKLFIYNLENKTFKKAEDLNRYGDFPCLFFDNFFSLGTRGN
uniref:F-box domain-containing protein n=1 Tax=Davidia involucrata TaxID=16924 RepID=A0A5B7BYK0_DAVIN